MSPFNTLEGEYRFAVRKPGAQVFTGITLADEEGGLLTAYFTGAHRAVSDGALAKLALAYPFMSLKIVLGIHFEALKLWLKGVPHTLRLR